MKVRLIVVGLLVATELGCVGVWFVRSPRGLEVFRSYAERQRVLEQKIAAIKTDIAQLDQQINDWNTYPFYKEAWAREHVNAAYPDEDIYLLEK